MTTGISPQCASILHLYPFVTA